MGTLNEAMDGGIQGWIGGKRSSNTGQEVQFQVLHIPRESSGTSRGSLGCLNYQFIQGWWNWGQKKIKTLSVLSILENCLGILFLVSK
jgi:hypothetical protein